MWGCWRGLTPGGGEAKEGVACGAPGKECGKTSSDGWDGAVVCTGRGCSREWVGD